VGEFYKEVSVEEKKNEISGKQQQRRKNRGAVKRNC